MEPSKDDRIRIPRSFLIPMIGYYLNLKSLPPLKRSYKWASVYTAFLLAFVVAAFLVPLSPVFPIWVSLYFILLFDSILVLLLFTVVVIETVAILHTNTPKNWLFGVLGWSRLVGRTRRFVFVTMLYFNYQEIMIGVFGITFIFLIHALF
jgi:hypothetical protein